MIGWLLLAYPLAGIVFWLFQIRHVRRNWDNPEYVTYGHLAFWFILNVTAWPFIVTVAFLVWLEGNVLNKSAFKPRDKRTHD